MAGTSQQPKGREVVLSPLNTAIDRLNLARESSSTALVKTALGSASDLLTLIRNSTVKADYVELGLTCADVCDALNQGTSGRRADQLGQSILGAIERLTTTMTGVQRHIIKRGKRNMISLHLHAKDDKKAIAAWRLDLNGILHVFNTELVTNTHPTASGAHHDVPNIHADHDTPNVEANTVPEVQSDITNTCAVVSDVYRNKRKDAGDHNRATHASAPGQSPPSLPSNPHATTSNVRRDVISSVHRDLVNTQAVVYDIHNKLKSLEGAGGQPQLTQTSAPGEPPPPPPRIFFGRDELIEKIVGFAEQLTPVALIGVGGIGKTSIVLAVLHNNHIKHRFGKDRRFIRCDELPASRTHFLRRLSKVIGASVENPEDLAALRPFLSSKEMLIVLDNAESILDPQGTSAQEMYAVVDELTRFDNICLCITCRISTIPPCCETLEIPTLSVGAAHDTFYRIYKYGERSDSINGIMERLDFHPLSITLLATVAQQNRWDVDRLTREWENHRTEVLHAPHSGSLSATIELSLASPMFQELGPDARELLGVVAFFPQGFDEKNIGWLFPTISKGTGVFDRFCTLSLTYRANGFIMMLAPLRDHLRPQDPTSSSFLCTIKDRYLTRLSVEIFPGEPSFEESRWVISEDVNVEHVLDVFTPMDDDSERFWNACAHFMYCLYMHKPRLVILGPRIEALPDDHPSKAVCLYDLSSLFSSVGNYVEQKRLLTHALELWRERGDDYQIAQTLISLSEANRQFYLHKEGVQQAKEASEIFERLGDAVNQAACLTGLTWQLLDDKQLDAAEEAASCAMDLLPEKGEEFRVCEGHRVLGNIYGSKGETEKAIHHFEVALGIASSLNVVDELFWVHCSLAELFFRQDRFDDAHTHVECAKSYAANNAYNLARVLSLQAVIWGEQDRPEEAKSEALQALDVFEKLGATTDAEWTRKILRQIDARGTEPSSGSPNQNDHGESASSSPDLP